MEPIHLERQREQEHQDRNTQEGREQAQKTVGGVAHSVSEIGGSRAGGATGGGGNGRVHASSCTTQVAIRIHGYRS